MASCGDVSGHDERRRRSGFNFQPDMNYFVRVWGITVQAARTDAQGQLGTQLFIPISGEGAHNVEVFDESGNFATASFFMEFGFDNIKETQDDLAKEIQQLRGGLESLTLAPTNPDSTSPSNAGDSNGTTPVAATGEDSGTIAGALVGVVAGATVVSLVWALRRRRPGAVA